MRRRVISLKVFILCMALQQCGRPPEYVVKSATVSVDSLSQILPLKDSLVIPVIYTNVSGLDKLPTDQSKEKFISAVLPSILIARHRLEITRSKLMRLKEKERWGKKDSVFVKAHLLKYRAKDIDDLTMRLLPLPNSIVLAQAAVETGWGESRFFAQANNLFGMWSMDSREPRIAAVKSRRKKTIWLRSYADMSQSVADYFDVLARAKAYRALREARFRSSNPFEVLPHLKYFSEQRTAYTRKLSKLIHQNNLTRFDQFRIHPDYIVEE